MTFTGIDYSYAKPNIHDLPGLGFRFAARYITDPGPTNKGISKEEFAALTTAGIRTVFVWEKEASAALGGFSQGVDDARAAQNNLIALRSPSPDQPLYFAVDFDAQPSQYARIGSYFEGVASVIGLHRTRVYGGRAILTYLHGRKLITGAWQTYAWSGGVRLPWVDLYQYRNGVSIGGGTVDLNYAYTNNYGQKSIYPPKKSAPAKTQHTSKHTPIYYEIQSGDTLISIAKKVHVPWRTLQRLNKLRNPDLIRADTRLRIH